MKMTDEDIAIMSRFDWAPFDSERKLPTEKMALHEFALSRLLHDLRSKKQNLVHTSMRDFYAEWVGA